MKTDATIKPETALPERTAGSQQRMVRRREEDEYLRAHGWTGGGGEWRHPWKRGVYLKWVALILEKEMQQMKRGTTPNAERKYPTSESASINP